MKWDACEDGIECGGGKLGARRWFLRTRDGGSALFDRMTGELVAGPWADDADIDPLELSEHMIGMREGPMPDTGERA